MTKSAVTDWSTTASSNTDVGGIGIEGSNTISNLDNAMREIMAQIATYITGASFTGSLTLTSTDAGATAGPILTLYRNSATPAASDIIGKVLFQGEDSAGNTQDYAEIYSVITDPTSTSEDANLLFRTNVAGTMTTHATITATGWNGMNIGATTPGTGAFTTLIAQGTTLTGNMLISKASPTITFTSTGTGSDSSISENGAGLTYAADSGNEVASSFHIWTVDGTQSAALNASALTLGTNVALAFAGTGAATTRTNLGLVIGTNVQAYDADLDAWAGKTAPTGTVVGTSDTQTLTAKTLTSPIIGTSPTAAGATWTNLGTVTTVDINGGTVDGVAIGASSASTGAFTTLTTSSTIVASGTVTGTRHISTGTGNAANPAYVLTTAGALAGLYTSAADTINFAINSASVGTVTSTGLNAMAIGATSASTGAFTTVAASSTITAVDSVTVTSTDAGAGLGPVLSLDRNSASPAASDVIGMVQFMGMDSGAAQQRYVDIFATIADPTAASEDGNLTFRTVVAGAMVTHGVLSATGWGLQTNLAISKVTPVITLTATGTGSDSTITENTSGLTYAADANNEVTASAHVFTVDGTQKFSIGDSVVTSAIPIRLPSYTVAGLPAAGSAGRMAYASNLRVFNGAGTQEGAGLGTGGTVVDNGTAWKISGTNVTAVA